MASFADMDYMLFFRLLRHCETVLAAYKNIDLEYNSESGWYSPLSRVILLYLLSDLNETH